MDLPHELRTLPPHAIEVLLFMGEQPEGEADPDAICEGTNLSDRAFGKAIRRLVTRNYLSMDEIGVYHLTPEGRSAVKTLAATQGAATPESAPRLGVPEPEAPVTAAPAASAPAVTRRLTVVLPRSLKVATPTTLFAGVEAPRAGAPHLGAATPLILRMEALNAEVTPPEHTLELTPGQPAAPVAFTLTAPAEGAVRVRVRAYQPTRLEVAEVGGMYFDVAAVSAAQPTADGLQAIAIDLNLR
ncbi:MAG: hypothetical protein Kow00120_00750 [Anaerolineae bacterium]